LGVLRYGPGMAHLLGYARVSTLEQNPDLQVDELTAAGCWQVWTDHGSGALDRRPQLVAVLEQLRPGDTLVVWRLDRLGRSLRHLIEVVTGLDEREVGFRSLRESIDTTTAGGRLVFHLFGALAQFERELIRDRTVAGLTAARARGRVGGRPSKLTAEQVRQARKMYDARELTVEQIGDVLGVSRTSIYRALGKTTTPASPAAAGPAPTEPTVAITTCAEVSAAVPIQHQRPAGGAPVAVRSRGRRAGSWCRPTQPIRSTGRWRRSAATPARRRRRRRWAGPGAGRRPAWGRGRCCRSAPPTRSAPGWCGTARPGGASCTPGHRRDRPADRVSARPVGVDVSGLLPEPAGYTELLEHLRRPGGAVRRPRRPVRLRPSRTAPRSPSTARGCRGSPGAG